MDVDLATMILGKLFVIMNPFINLPILFSMANSKPVAQQRNVAIDMLFYAAALCAVILLLSAHIIAIFGVTIGSFRGVSGLVLLGIALSMRNGEPVTSHKGRT